MRRKAAVAAMEKKYIRTIGDLAQQSQADMHGFLGKHGDIGEGFDGQTKHYPHCDGRRDRHERRLLCPYGYR